MIKNTHHFLRSFTYLFLGVLFLALPVLASNYDVTNTSDSGAGSLYQDVTDSNNAGGSNDILWESGANGIISLSSDLPAIIGGTTLDATNATSNVTIAGPGMIPLGAGDITFSNDSLSHGFTVSAGITDSGELVKTGSGSLALSADNTYGGGTDIQSGTLSISNDYNLGLSTGALTLGGGTLLTTAGIISSRNITLNSANSTIDNGGFNSILNGVISGIGGLIVQSSGTITLTGTNTYGGGTTINAGVASISDNSNLGASTGTLTLNGGTLQTTDAVNFSQNIVIGPSSGTISVQDENPYVFLPIFISTFSNISGTGGLTKEGYGTLALSGTNTYSGGTTINLGMFQAEGVNVMPTAGAVTLSNVIVSTFDLNGFSQTIGDLSGGGTIGGNITLGNATLTVDNVDNTTYSGVIYGTGSLVKVGTGTLTLEGLNPFPTSPLQPYSGGTIITEGTLSISNNLNLGVIAGTITFNGGTLETTSSVSSARNIFIENGSSGTINVDGGINSTFSGVIDGSSVELIKIGTGTLTLSGVNTYSGDTEINAGTLSISTDTALGNPTNTITFNGGALQITKADLNSSRNITLDAGGGTINIAGFSAAGSLPSTFSGTLSGGGGLTEIGGGTLTLSGINNYSGGTTLNGANLMIAHDYNLGDDAGALTLSNKGTLEIVGGSTETLTWGGIYSSTSTVGITSSRNIILGSGGGNLDTNSSSSIFNGSFINAGGGLNIINQSSVYWGQIEVGADAFTAASLVDVRVSTNAALELNGFNQTIGNLTGGDGVIDLGSAALTVTNSENTNYYGDITGVGGSLVKEGTGTLVLDGTNTYDGGTTISNGTLSISYEGAYFGNLGAVTSTVTFNGGTLQITNSLTSGRDIFIQSGGGTVETTDGTSVTLIGDITGIGELTKTGSGTLALSDSNNTYGGGTSIDEGTLSVANDGDLGVSTGTITFNGVGSTLLTSAGIGSSRNILIDSSSGTIDTSVYISTFSGIISGTGGLTKLGSGILTLTGTNTYGGGTTIDAGTLSISADSNLGASTGTLTMNGGTLLTSSGLTSSRNITLSASSGTINTDGNTSTFSGVISGVGGLTETGGGTLILSNTNTYGGDTTIDAGTLQAGAANVLNSTGTVTLANSGTAFNLNNYNQTIGDLTGVSGSTVTLGSGNLTVNSTVGSTFSGLISGVGGLTKNGSGTLILASTNTYGGGTTIDAGTLSISADSNLGASTGTLTMNGGTLLTSSGLTSSRNITLSASSGTINTDGNTSTFSGVISGVGGLTETGGGTLILSNTNTYGGDTTIDAGTLSISADSNLGASTGTLTMNGGTLQTGAGLTSSRNMTLSSGGGTIDDSVYNSTFTGVLSGVGGLTKAGAGTLVLTNSNTYGGGTTIDAGTLQAGAANVLNSTGAVILANSGTAFNLNNYNQTIGDLTGVSGSTVTLGSGTLTVNNVDNTTDAGVITGTGGVVKQSTGTLTLSGANTYGGDTTIDAGTLSISADSNLGASTGTLTMNGGTLQTGAGLTSSRNMTLSSGGGTIDDSVYNSTFTGVLSGVGGLTKAGAGTLVLTNSNTYGGGTTIDAGTLQAGAANVLNSTGAVILANSGTAFNLNNYNQTIGDLTGVSGSTVTLGSGTLTVNNVDNTTDAGVITGTGGVVKQSTGTLTLSGANTYGGGTTIDAGTLSISADSNLGASTGTLTMNGGTLQTYATVTSTRSVTLNSGGGMFDMEGATSSMELDGVISGTGGLLKDGGGTLILTGTNTYSGGTTINDGTLSISSYANLGTSTGTLTFNGGMLQTDFGLFFSQNMTFGADGGAINTGVFASTFTGVISGIGGLTKLGSGTLLLTGANTYGGGTTIDAGTLQAGAANVLNSTGSVTLANSGTVFDLNSYNQTIGDLSGVSGSTVTLGSGTLTVNNVDNTTYAGMITGTGGIVKQSTGTLILSGANTYGGGTTIDAGTLSISADNNLGASTGTLTMNGGALQTYATVTSARSVTLSSSGGTFDTEGSTSSLELDGVVSGTGSLTKTGSGTLSLTDSNTYGGGTTIDAGTLSISADSNLGASTGTLTMNGGTLQTSSGLTSSRNITLSASSGTINTDGISSTFSGAISGVGGLTETGGGTLILSGANTYGGGTTIDAGTLQAGAANVLSTGTVTLANTAGAVLNLNNYNQTISDLSGGGTSGGNITLGSATLTVSNVDSTAFAGVISGTGQLVKQSTGTLTLTGTNTYGGGTTIDAGTLSISADNNLGASTGTLTLNGGALQTYATVTSARSVTLSSSGGTFDTEGSTSSLIFSGTLSGIGDLTKTGTGTLTLSGTSTDGGGTTIDAGTLQAGAANVLNSTGAVILANSGTAFNLNNYNQMIGDLSGVSGSTVTLGSGNLTVNNVDNTTDAGVITGTGGVIKQSTGTLTLTGTNTYGGGTTIDAGTLSISADSNLGASTGTLTMNGGTLQTGAGLTSSRNMTLSLGDGTIDDSVYNSTFTGIVSGTGSLTKIGSGTLTLSGANTYGGGTTIDAGTLSISSDSNLGASTGTLTLNGGTLQTYATITLTRTMTLNSSGGTFDTEGSTSSLTLSGVLSGIGGLTKNGAGTLVLVGTNTYGGGTTIDAGTLQAGAANVLSTGTVTLANTAGAVLNLNNYNQTISDLSGGGTSGGNITLGSATLTVNNADNTIYAGVISGTGQLVKQSTGTLTLSGANTYTGGTEVSAGTLQMGAAGALPSILVSDFALPRTIAGAVTVDSAGTFDLDSYSQTIGALTNNGTVKMGTAVLNASSYSGNGTLSATIQSASVYGNLNVTGNADISGTTLQIGPVNSFIPSIGQSYTVVNAGSLTGTFATISNSFPLINWITRYSATQAQIAPEPNGTAFSSLAQTPNQQAVAQVLDAAASNTTGAFGKVINSLYFLSASQAAAAYTQISGDSLASIPGAALRTSTIFVTQMNQRMYSESTLTPGIISADSLVAQVASAGQGDILELGYTGKKQTSIEQGLWVQALGGFSHTKENSEFGSPESYSTTDGFELGYDATLMENFLMGASLGYARTSLQLYDRSSAGHTLSREAGLYARYAPNPWFVNGSLSYATYSNILSRTISFPGIDETANASFAGQSFTTYMETGYKLDDPDDNLAFEPSLALQETHLSQDAYSESGAPGLDLSVNKQSFDSTTSYLGGRVSSVYRGADIPIEMGLRTAWLHEFGDTSRPVTAQFADAPGSPSFSVNGTPQSREAAAVGFDLRFLVNQNWQAYFDYSATISGEGESHGLLGGVRLSW